MGLRLLLVATGAATTTGTATGVGSTAIGLAGKRSYNGRWADGAEVEVEAVGCEGRDGAI